MSRPKATALIAVGTALAILCAAAGCGGGDDDGNGGPGAARVSWGAPDDPKGVVMLLHGGGWLPSDSGYAEQKANADNYEDQGFATVAIGYDEGAKGFQQVIDVYREARRRYPDLPICASGISAGGNLALMLATREPDLACVVALAAPTDLTSLAEQDPEGDEAHQAAVAAFGKDQLAKFSPVRYADRIKAKVLLILAESDPVDPVDQGDELAQVLPGLQLLILPPGPVSVPFAHFGGVQPDAQEVVVERVLDFLDEATQPS
jgi:dipeptidyl aminopeptidase/acylaminoacyl peptidase